MPNKLIALTRELPCSPWFPIASVVLQDDKPTTLSEALQQVRVGRKGGISLNQSIVFSLLADGETQPYVSMYSVWQQRPDGTDHWREDGLMFYAPLKPVEKTIHVIVDWVYNPHADDPDCTLDRLGPTPFPGQAITYIPRRLECRTVNLGHAKPAQHTQLGKILALQVPHSDIILTLVPRETKYKIVVGDDVVEMA